MSIKSDLNYLEETKGLIKEAIINKGQDIEDNTPFREYVDKIDNISTEPTKPMGVKVYKSIEILDDQTDLINYYVQGAQTGEFANLNCYRFHFNYLDTDSVNPFYGDLNIVDTSPNLMRLSFHAYSTNGSNLPATKYYFNNMYTQAYIQIARSLGLYDTYVANFLNNYGITEEQLLQFNGWYIIENNTLATTTAPIISHCNLSWIIKCTVQDFLTGNISDIDQIHDYIDFDETLLNIVLEEEDSFDNIYESQRQLHGGFLQQASANVDDLKIGKVAFTQFGKITGTIADNGQLNYTPSTSQQTIPAGYTSGGIIAPVTSSIDSDITPSNIRMGAKILEVTGNYTSDATATEDEIVGGKIAYVKGQKITGRASSHNDVLTYANALQATDTSSVSYSNKSIATIPHSENGYLDIDRVSVSDGFWKNAGSNCRVGASVVAFGIGLKANKIKAGETILGITGTYGGQGIKEYASETDMNNDIDNIAEGEVVKVVINGTTAFYLKETTMKKLIKEEDTLSASEYDEATDLSDDILGTNES